MSNPTWGSLSKSQIDPETIEEAIDRIVDEHNDDEESHLAVGQSLQSHKASEIIDHAAQSVVYDKITKYQSWNLPFESIDGYSTSIGGNGSITPNFQALEFMVPDTDEDEVRIWVGEVYNVTPSIAKNPKMTFSMKLGDAWAYDTYVLWGNYSAWQVVEAEYIGIKVKHDDDEKVYGVYRLSSLSETETELAGVDPADPHLYTVEVEDDGATIKFYVDNVLKATVYPGWSAWTSDYLFSIGTKATTDGENPPAFFWNFQISQDV